MEDASGAYSIRVKTLVPAEYSVSVTSTTSVAGLKNVIGTIVGTPAYRQRLIWRGRVLSDDSTMGELGELSRITPTLDMSACMNARVAVLCCLFA
jgi:hypothetical protein